MLAQVESQDKQRQRGMSYCAGIEGGLFPWSCMLCQTLCWRLQRNDLPAYLALFVTLRHLSDDCPDWLWANCGEMLTVKFSHYTLKKHCNSMSAWWTNIHNWSYIAWWRTSHLAWFKIKVSGWMSCTYMQSVQHIEASKKCWLKPKVHAWTNSINVTHELQLLLYTTKSKAFSLCW